MFKKALLTLILSIFAIAGTLNVNDQLDSFSLPDQFDRIHNVNSALSIIIISFQKDTSKMVNEFLSSKSDDFLKNHNCEFISDISGMPSIITKMFAIPEMRDYKYPILLIYDDKGSKFLKKEHFATIYNLDHGVVTNINFVSTTYELEPFFKQ